MSVRSIVTFRPSKTTGGSSSAEASGMSLRRPATKLVGRAHSEAAVALGDEEREQRLICWRDRAPDEPAGDPGRLDCPRRGVWPTHHSYKEG
eukprot:m.68495 g.68495  ORF g.68495 m.68495 type:complete len:92 (-) comp18317_c0_seq2:469-744(-)